jgi:hypothetical protein
VKVISFVELVYEDEGRNEEFAWGMGSDSDITASALQRLPAA